MTKSLGLGLALLVGCAGNGVAAQSPLLAGEEDVSTPIGDGDMPLGLDTSSIKRPLRGAIVSVKAVADSGGLGRRATWFDVEVAGDDVASTRTVRVSTKGRLPFTAGDMLDVRWSKRPIGWDAWAIDMELRDAAGALWAGLYTSMDDHDGWTLEMLPAADGIPCRVAVTHLSRRAVVPTGAWRKLEAPDGVWAASAECPGPPPSPPGAPPIPDYSPDPTVVQVSRLARP
jgi:hypothetical protein